MSVRNRLSRGVALSAALCATLLTTGCGIAELAAPEEFCGRNAKVDVSVVAGGSPGPSIGWSPECRAVAVLVEDTTGEDDLWVVESSAGIRPGLRYGSTPAGAGSNEGPEPLESGATYVVTVFGGPPGSGDDYPVGSTAFVAP